MSLKKGLVLDLDISSEGLQGTTKFKDKTPYENNGTLSNVTLTTDHKGKANSAGVFNGTSSYIDVGTIVPTIKSISFWCKPSSISTTEEIIDLNGTQYIKATNGVLSAEGFISPTIYVNSLSSNTITTDWQLITITTETAINASDVDIGRLEGSSFFTGSIERPQIWNRALSADEVKLLYESYNPCLKLYGGDDKIKSEGYIRVDKNVNNSIYFDNPESNLYGKQYFYVMQYQARNNGGVPQSTGTGLPWVSISQTDAITASENAGLHLMTNWEWMAIARDIEQVDENWTGGQVGSGMIKRGNVGTTDDGSYDGADPETGILNDKAKLKLSNGEEIYHFSGNVWEWVDYTIAGAGSQPKDNDDTTWAWNEFSDIDSWGNILGYENVGPKNTSLDGSTGAGRIYSANDATYATVRALLRGGRWSDTSNAGVFALWTNDGPTAAYRDIGFRCARYGNE